MRYQQKNSGRGSIQVGTVGGNLTIVNVTPGARAGRATSEQREALRMLDQVPKRGAILSFMRREFGTSMVLHLEPWQLYRLRRYLAVVLGGA